MVLPCRECEQNGVPCLKKTRGPGCQRCAGRKVRCSAVEEQRRYGGRQGDGEGENDKGTEAEENREFREWRRGKDGSFEEDSGGIGGDAGRPARDDR